MLDFLARRLPSVLLTTWLASVIAFALPRLAPGDPAVVLAGPDPDPQTIAAIRASLGLDASPFTQYWRWLGDLLQGDLGNSYQFGRSVGSLIGDRLSSTLELAALAVLLTVILGAILGIVAGATRSPSLRRALDVSNGVLVGVPGFLVALGLILVFGIFNSWLPVSGEVSFFEDPVLGLKYLILPAVALALTRAAMIARLLQTSMLSTRNEEFVELAIAKGASRLRVTLRHVLRNSLGPAIVALGIRIGDLLAGTVIIEAIFARNGLGSLVVSSVQSQDYVVLQSLILASVVVAIAIQLGTEVLLARLDPRAQLSG